MIKFEACYPVQATLYMSGRFEELNNVYPISIQGKKDVFSEELFLNGEQGYKFIQSLVSQETDHISLYEFVIDDHYRLVERFTVNNSGFIKVITQLSETTQKDFLSFIFKLNGVLLFGEMSTGEAFITRDDICCEFAHNLLPNYQPNYSATWMEGEPFINHFFMYKKEPNSTFSLNQSVALGGKPHSRKTGNANFYLMKALPRFDEEAYITSNDDLSKIEPFEKEFVLALVKSLEQADNVTHRIMYSVAEEN